TVGPAGGGGLGRWPASPSCPGPPAARLGAGPGPAGPCTRPRAARRLRIPIPADPMEHVMSLSHHQQYQLRLIEAGLLSSDPRLAGVLGVFGRLCAGQGMPAWEQVPSRKDRIRQAAALLTEAIAVVAAAISLLLRTVLLLASAAIPRHRRRLPAPKPERTPRAQGARDRSAPA